VIDKEKLEEEEKKITKLMDEMNERLSGEFGGKPYLLVLETLHEIDREEGKSKIAAQWSWRSNIDSRTEGRSAKDVEASRTLMGFLADQLRGVVEHSEHGIAKKYRLGGK